MSARSLQITQSVLFCLAIAVAGVAWLSVEVFEVKYTALGLIGAIFANSTGAGGGVVFIPTFHQLGLSDQQAVATSFGIQTFGMTAGALAWLAKFHLDNTLPRFDYRLVLVVTALVTPLSIIGLYVVEVTAWQAPASLETFFAWFSIALGLCILATIFLFKARPDFALTKWDIAILLIVAYIGGLITAWLSVGVGELVAFYLIARGANPAAAIASAVVITALSVWSIAPITFATESAAVMNIVLVAGPAAVLGGLSARYLVERLSTFWLKIFFGSWLILVGLVT